MSRRFDIRLSRQCQRRDGTSVIDEDEGLVRSGLHSGKPFDAVRAWIAKPIGVTLFRFGKRMLVDRAVVNPLSIAPTMNDITDPTLVVDLRGSAESRPASAISASTVHRSRWSHEIPCMAAPASASVTF